MKRLFVFLSIVMLNVALFASGNFVSYVVNGKTYEGYYTTPSKTAPLILMVHDWDGVNAYEIKRAKMLYDLGYAVFVLDMFGKGVKADTMDARKALTGALYKDRVKMRALLEAGYAAAKAQGANVNQAVGIGYCFGGTVMLEMARSGANLKGFAIFHGGLATPEGQDYKQTRGPILVLHGSADASVSLTEFSGLIGELEKTNIKHEAISYSGAPHAFSVFGSDRYREDADKKSWARFTGFLKEVL